MKSKQTLDPNFKHVVNSPEDKCLEFTFCDAPTHIMSEQNYTSQAYSYLNLMTVDVTASPVPTGPNGTKLVQVTQTYLQSC